MALVRALRFALTVMVLATAASIPAPVARADDVRFAADVVAVVTAGGRYDFTVELAIDDRQRAQGLMGRPALAPGAGMLFDFKVPQPVTMWMKNTHIALDMLFIDASGRIANIVENTQPMSLATIASSRPVRAVLELNAGTARRLGVKPGDRVLHPIFESRR